MRLRSYNYPIPRVPPTPIPVYITSPLNTSQSASLADFTSARAFADKKISQRLHTVSTMYLHCNALIPPSKYRRPCRIASGTQTPRLGPLDPAHLTAKTSARLRVLSLGPAPTRCAGTLCWWRGCAGPAQGLYRVLWFRRVLIHAFLSLSAGVG
jgi:hypothetical protein